MEGSQVWWNKGHMKSDKEGGSGARWLSLSLGISPTSQHHDFGQITGPESRIYTMRTVIISTWGQFHWQSTSAIAYGLCLKGPQAWGLVLYNCHLESLNNSNIFNYSVKSYRAMDHEWGRLGSLAHTQFCLLLPLPVLNLLLPSSWCP